LLPEDLEENPLDVVIATEVERFDTTGGEVISFKLLGARRQLPAVAQAALLRICQESLTNMRKYAEARNVEVTLDFALDSVTLSVADDGVGFDPDAVRIEEGRGGFGLTGMRQRARLLQGDVEIASAPGKGTRVEARIPTT
jgi:signal transduction histidine kinase